MPTTMRLSFAEPDMFAVKRSLTIFVVSLKFEEASRRFYTSAEDGEPWQEGRVKESEGK